MEVTAQADKYVHKKCCWSDLIERSILLSTKLLVFDFI